MNKSEANDFNNSENEKYKLSKKYSLIIGIYLSIFALALILLLVLMSLSIATQQVLVVFISLLTILALDFFKQAVNNQNQKTVEVNLK